MDITIGNLRVTVDKGWATAELALHRAVTARPDGSVYVGTYRLTSTGRLP
jgi:hypothetical protein